MSMFSRRLQVLLDQPRWDRLSAAARARGLSVAVVVREAIDRSLTDPGATQRDEGLARLLVTDPIDVPLHPGDLRRELAAARDRLG